MAGAAYGAAIPSHNAESELNDPAIWKEGDAWATVTGGYFWKEVDGWSAVTARRSDLGDRKVHALLLLCFYLHWNHLVVNWTCLCSAKFG
jgi:hypothetical protein